MAVSAKNPVPVGASLHVEAASIGEGDGLAAGLT